MRRKKIVVCFIALCLTLTMLVSPISMAYAASHKIATLDVDEDYRTWAYAETQSTGYVTVELKVDLSGGTYEVEGAGSMTGFVYVSIMPYDTITYADSYHRDDYTFIIGTWRPLYGYWFYG